jgi:hypothetical protein
MSRALTVALVLAACGACDAQEYARDVVADLRCVWAHRHKQCFCLAGRGNEGFMTWAPPETCKRGTE